jgi:hypothetical protein
MIQENFDEYIDKCAAELVGCLVCMENRKDIPSLEKCHGHQSIVFYDAQKNVLCV